MDRSEPSSSSCSAYICIDMLVFPSFSLLGSIVVLLFLDLVVGLREEVSSLALDGLILSVVESINLDVCSLCTSRTGCNSCDMSCICSVAILSLHWFGYRLIEIHDQVVIDGILVR